MLCPCWTQAETIEIVVSSALLYSLSFLCRYRIYFWDPLACLCNLKASMIALVTIVSFSLRTWDPISWSLSFGYSWSSPGAYNTLWPWILACVTRPGRVARLTWRLENFFGWYWYSFSSSYRLRGNFLWNLRVTFSWAPQNFRQFGRTLWHSPIIQIQCWYTSDWDRINCWWRKWRGRKHTNKEWLEWKTIAAMKMLVHLICSGLYSLGLADCF